MAKKARANLNNSLTMPLEWIIQWYILCLEAFFLVLYKDYIMHSIAESIKYVRILHTAKGRSEEQCFIAEGLRTVLSFIKAGYAPIELYATESIINRLDTTIGYTLVSTQTMERMSASSTPSGILAIFAMPQNPDPQTLTSGLVMAEISDPGNMGTLIRSCAAFGFSSVVIINGCDPFNPKVIQATAGSLPYVSLFRWTWQELLEHKKDLQLCALEPQKGKPAHALQLKNTLLIVGNEAHGIDPEWLKKCDSLLTLPINHEIESLNAAIAGSIALFLASEQQ